MLTAPKPTSKRRRGESPHSKVTFAAKVLWPPILGPEDAAPRLPSKLSLGKKQQPSDSKSCRPPNPPPNPAPPTAFICSGAWGRQGSRHLEKPLFFVFFSSPLIKNHISGCGEASAVILHDRLSLHCAALPPSSRLPLSFIISC